MVRNKGQWLLKQERTKRRNKLKLRRKLIKKYNLKKMVLRKRKFRLNKNLKKLLKLKKLSIQKGKKSKKPNKKMLSMIG